MQKAFVPNGANGFTQTVKFVQVNQAKNGLLSDIYSEMKERGKEDDDTICYLPFILGYNGSIPALLQPRIDRYYNEGIYPSWKEKRLVVDGRQTNWLDPHLVRPPKIA